MLGRVLFNEGLFALCLERFALWGLHSGLSGIAKVFSLVQAFVLFRESWPAGLNAPPFGGSALTGGHAVA